MIHGSHGRTCSGRLRPNIKTHSPTGYVGICDRYIVLKTLCTCPYISTHVHCTFQEIVFASGIENRVDPDQLAPQKGADLELLA